MVGEVGKTELGVADPPRMGLCGKMVDGIGGFIESNLFWYQTREFADIVLYCICTDAPSCCAEVLGHSTRLSGFTGSKK